MRSWTCPACGRRFGRVGQPHVCAPGVSIDEWFGGRPEAFREIFEAVITVLDDVDEERLIEIDAVEVGLLVKTSRTFVELRPRRDRFDLSMVMSRPLDDPRVHRSVAFGRRWANFVWLASADEVDDRVAEWLVESYASVTDPAS